MSPVDTLSVFSVSVDSLELPEPDPETSFLTIHAPVYAPLPSHQGETDGVTATVSGEAKLPGCLKAESLLSTAKARSVVADEEVTSTPPSVEHPAAESSCFNSFSSEPLSDLLCMSDELKHLDCEFPFGGPIINPDNIFDFLDPYTYTFMCSPDDADTFGSSEEVDNSASEEIDTSSPESLDHSYQLLFGYSDIQNLSDDELDGLIPHNDHHYGKLSERRANLFVISILVNGCLVRAMVDTGYTGFLLLDPDVAERTGVKHLVVSVPDSVVKGGKAHINRDVTVGDQRVVKVTQGERCDLDVAGFKASASPWTMPLGKHFDAVLGLEFFKHLQKNCKGLIDWDFINSSFSFTLKGAKAKTVVSPHHVSAGLFEAPFCTKDHLRSLVTKTAAVPHDLPSGTRVLRLDDDFHLIRTRDGDDFLLHEPSVVSAATSSFDPSISVSDTPPDASSLDDVPQAVAASVAPPTAEPSNDSASQPPAGSSSAACPTPTPLAAHPSDSNSRSASGRDESGSDDWDGRDLVKDAVRDANRANWAKPVSNPHWTPMEPSESDDFRDDDFLSRVDLRQNDLDTLRQREKEVGVQFIDTLKANGVIFRDDVPTSIIPDRGLWNGTLDFTNPEDASKPICKKAYRLSPDETRAAAAILRDLLLRGTIRPSKSPWGTPIFLVPKSDGGWRMCCDYRDLNSKLVHEAYSLPAADQLFDQLGDARFFSSHDCTWGYHQLRWAPDAIPKTAIRTHLGTFEFLVVNFGSTSAPAQWTRLMEAILRPYLGDFVVIFLDDMCIFSKTAEEHVRHLNTVYRVLAKNSIYLRFGKCFFFNQRFKFLGWIIENGTLKPDPDKLKALREWPIPTSKQEVRSFTGFCNFYKRLIPRYSKRMALLHDLQRDCVPNSAAEFAAQKCWTDAHTAAFKDIISALCSDPVVHIADPTLPYVLDTDASEVAVGGILSQVDSSGQMRVIEYYSRRLSASQRNYAPGKLELLALIVTLEHWRYYLKGAPKGLTIITDHEPLLAIRKTKNPSRMLLRWLSFLEQFNFVIQYRKGKLNPADLMSRPPDSHPVLAVPIEKGIQVTDDDSLPDDAYPDLSASASQESLNQLIELSVTHGFFNYDDDFLNDHITEASLDSLRKASAEDPLFKSVASKAKDYRGKFRIEDGLLWWIKTGSPGLFIPSSLPALREAIFKQHHGHITAGHFGARRTAAKIRQSYWWPNIDRQVADWVKACSVCLTTKRKTLPSSVMFPHDIPDMPWDVVFMDEVSGLIPSFGHDAIWVFMDKLSKMVHFVPVVKLGLDSPGLARLFFWHIFRLHGLPRVVVSDRDVRINDDFWLTLFKLAGVHSNMSTPFRPQTDSSGESAVKICIDLCRGFVNSARDDWYELLPSLEFAYNSTPGSSGHSPFEINGLQQPRSAQTRLIDASLRRAPATGRSALGASFLKRHARVISDAKKYLRSLASRVAQPEKTVTHRRRQETFKVDDRVMLRRSFAGSSFPQDKMAPLYVGPFRVDKVVSPSSYELELPASMRVPRTQNIDNLWRPDPNLIFPPPEIIEERDPDQPAERLSAAPLVIIRLFHETDDYGIVELFVEVENQPRKFTLHELCIRQHFLEIVDALGGPLLSTVRKLPYFLGRSFVQRNWGPEFPGFISAFDPNNSAQAYQLEFEDCGFSYWGPRDHFTIKRFPAREMHMLRVAPLRRPLRVLEVCCGSKSFARQVQKMFPSAYVVTLDIDSRFCPTVHADIRLWNYLKHFPSGFFDIIWCSPPCTEYSPAKAGSPRNLEHADSIVHAVLQLLRVAQPRVAFLENPHTMLFKRPCMLSQDFLQRFACTYCKYRFKYKKPTDIWSNIPLELKHCDISHCPARIASGVHEQTSQQGASGDTPGVPRAQANFVPSRLLRVLITVAVDHLKKTCSDRITWA